MLTNSMTKRVVIQKKDLEVVAAAKSFALACAGAAVMLGQADGALANTAAIASGSLDALLVEVNKLVEKEPIEQEKNDALDEQHSTGTVPAF